MKGRTLPKALLCFAIALTMIFGSMSVSFAADNAAWENNGVGLDKLVSTQVGLVATGDTVTKGVSFTGNVAYLTQAQLDAARADVSTLASTQFGDCATDGIRVYSSSENHGTQEWNFSKLKGIDVVGLAENLGVDTNTAMALGVTSNDGMTYSLSDVFGTETDRYVYGTDGAQGAEITPALALNYTAEPTTDRPSQETPAKLPADPTAADSAKTPRLVYGQTNIDDDNNCHFVYGLDMIRYGAAAPALSVKDMFGAEKTLSLASIVKMGVYETEYNYFSSGVEEMFTHHLKGIPLTTLLDNLGINVAPGQFLKIDTSDNFASTIDYEDIAYSFVAWDATEANGDPVSNTDKNGVTASLRIYGPGQYGNKVVKKFVTGISVLGDPEEGKLPGYVEDSVLYVAVQKAAGSSDYLYYYYTMDELKEIGETHTFDYIDHSVSKHVTGKGALITTLTAEMVGVNVTDDMIVQYAEEDGYHADAKTAVEESSYKDKMGWMLNSHTDAGGNTCKPVNSMVCFGINEQYDEPDENNVNDPIGVYKDADDGSGYLRVYRQRDDANAAVMKTLMGLVISYDGAALSGKDGYTLKCLSATNKEYEIKATTTVKGLMKGMEYPVRAKTVTNAKLLDGEAAVQKITCPTDGGTGTVVEFYYDEDTYFYVNIDGKVTNYIYSDFLVNSVQTATDEEAAALGLEAPYGYSYPMLYRYNGGWLTDITGKVSSNQKIILVAENGKEYEISPEDAGKYFIAYNNTQSKSSTNTPEGKRVTKTYDDPIAIIPEDGILTDEATKAAGKDVTKVMDGAGLAGIKVVSPVAPAVPKLTAKNTASKSVALSWNKVAGATGYVVVRYELGSGASFKVVKAAQAATTSFVDKTVTPGKYYYYTIKSVDLTNGTGSAWFRPSAGKWLTVKAATPAPAAISGTAKGSKKVALTVKPGSAESGVYYEIYRAKAGGGSWQMIKTTAAKTYTDTVPTVTKSGTKYYYRARAYTTYGGNKIYSGYCKSIAVLAK